MPSHPQGQGRQRSEGAEALSDSAGLATADDGIPGLESGSNIAVKSEPGLEAGTVGFQESESAPEHSNSEPPTSAHSHPAYSLVYSLQGHKRSISSIKFSPDGRYLASGAADKLIKVWSVPTGALLHTLAGHTQGVNDICWSTDSAYVASASDDRTVRVWNAQTVSLA